MKARFRKIAYWDAKTPPSSDVYSHLQSPNYSHTHRVGLRYSVYYDLREDEIAVTSEPHNLALHQKSSKSQ
jgi:hypothetical protein